MRYDIESIEKRKNTSQTFKRVFHIVLIIFMYNAILLFFSSMNKMQNFSVFGYKAYIITTDSMEPTIKQGDAIITKKAKEKDLKEGDIITFNRDNESITHRILTVDKEEDKILYVTKGDNNNVEDKQKVSFNDVEGKQVIVMPKIGYIIEAAENQLVILIITLVVLIFLLGKIQSEERKYNRREKKKNETKEKNII